MDTYNMTRREFEALLREKSVGIRYELPPLPKWVLAAIIYPFAGAAARVVFAERGNAENSVSTYLDVNDELGCMGGKPYFEIYPASDGETCRYWPHEQPDMYREIVKALASRRRKDRLAARKGDAS